jgi:hypothetical protein
MTTITEYQEAVQEAMFAPVQGPSAYQSGVGAGVDSQWFSVVPRVPGEYVMGALVTISTFVNAPSATAASVSAAVNLDIGLNYVQVAPAPGVGPRSYTASRLATQEVERLCLGDNAAGISYPGTAVASIASASSSTIVNTVFVPVGGQAGAVKLHTAPIANAFTGTGVTYSSQIWVRSISGANPTVVTFEDNFTNSLSSGAAIDITANMPIDIACDYIDFVGLATASLSGITMWGADGSILVDVNSGETTTLNQMQKYGVNANSLITSMVFSPRRQIPRKTVLNLAAATSLEILAVAFDNGVSAGDVHVKAGTTPVPNASQNTGTAVAGGQLVLPKSANTGTSSVKQPLIRRF